MAETIEEMESELAHFGVKGMKWGVKRNGEERSEKSMARRNASADKGDALLAKSGGSGTKAVGKIVGRRIAIDVGAHVLNSTASVVFKDKPAVAKGVQAVVNWSNAGLAVKDVVDIHRINRSDQRNGITRDLLGRDRAEVAKKRALGS